MKSNGLLKWLMIPAALLVLFVGIRLFSSSPNRSTAASSRETDAGHLTPLEMKTLGIEGDTPRDTVATLVGLVKQLRGDLQSSAKDNQQQKAENERLRGRESAVDERIRDTLNTERDRSREEREQAAAQQKQIQSLLQDFQHRLDTPSTGSDHTELPVGLGLEDGDAVSMSGNRLSWVEPQDTRPPNGKTTASRPSSSADGFQFSTGFDSGADRASTSVETATEAAASENSRGSSVTRSVLTSSLKPIYTVPTNATLMGSVAMTALIGRVPIDGTVNDPYPFKVLIGPDNLTANGIDLPDVAGAVVSGIASGDWTLSCVRGRIRSMTFVFHDGTIRTVPSSSSNTSETGNTAQGGLGWISDPYGIPCVSGDRRSNAEQYLTSQLLITAAGAGAASLINSQSGNYSYISGSNGNTLGTVGISGNEAMGRILAGGVQEMSQWVNKLYGQAFAAIYVRPGAQVAVHIEQPLEIDYDSQGRKVRHDSGDVHVPDLD